MSEIAIVFLCLMFNALIAGAEMALVAVNRPRLRELVRLSGLRVLRNQRVHMVVYSSQTRL